jgi:hypothetical protein
MEERIFQEIAELRKKIHCRKGFICVESGFKKICRAKDVGLKRHILCLEYVPSECEFAVVSDNYYYCTCVLRNYLAKNHQRMMLSED